MVSLSIGQLRSHADEVIDRVAAGEQIIITRAGKPIAELGPLRRRPLASQVLLDRWRRLPPVDYASLRAEIDETLDAGL